MMYSVVVMNEREWVENEMMDSVVVKNEGELVENEMMNSSCRDERVDECMSPEIK